MTRTEIRTAIEELRHATRPEQRTSYERALLALAELVDQTTSMIDDEARRRAMPTWQLRLINNLRLAVPRRSSGEAP